MEITIRERFTRFAAALAWPMLAGAFGVLIGAETQWSVHRHDAGDAYQSGREQGRKEERSLWIAGCGYKIGDELYAVPVVTDGAVNDRKPGK